MSDRALVIGLDAYQNKAWELRAAVRDALAFAKWVTEPGAGRATEETLTLLLSPHPDRPVKDVKYKEATTENIWRALFDHKTNGAGAERFWFFYAGHGIAPAGGGPDEAPVVVPSNVKDLDYYRQTAPIDLGVWIRTMQVCPPEYQVYFVDACRGIVVSEDVVTATKMLFFDLSKIKPEAQARQAVLFATTAGQLANEQGLHGLFGGALMDGLRGTGPALEADVEKQEFVLTFGRLAEYAKRRIQIQAEEARRANKTLPTQEPAESLFRLQSSLEIARFAQRPRSLVKVFVDPEKAAESGRAGIRRLNETNDAWERQDEKASPLAVPIEWKLPSTVHKIEIEAQGYDNWSKKVEVFGPIEVRAALVRTQKAFRTSRRSGIRPGGLESLDVPEEITVSRRPARPDGAELGAGKVGRLLVSARDRYTRIEVFDTTDKRVTAAWERLDVMLPVGAYRVDIALPTERPAVQRVLVTADEPVVISIQPDPQLHLPPGAGMIQLQGGVSEPSEMFGVATTTHLGSLLAWAAWAAQFPAEGHGMKLRALGVEPLAPVPGQCFVRVLVGDATGPNPQAGPVETLVLDMSRPPAEPKPVPLKAVPALEGFAAQWQGPVDSHEASLTVQASGLNPRRLPLPFVAGYVWTIVIVRESTQLTEIHRYLQRLEAPSPFAFDDTIRLVEQNWRALEARTPLYEGEAERLLARDLDPLSLAVLGYRLALENRREEVKHVVERLKQFGLVALVDVHVLASFVGDRDENMQRAVNSPSAPIVGEGYRLMEAWLVERFAEQNLAPPIAPGPFIGGVWTSFDTRGQGVISKAFPVSEAPAWAERLLPAANATAKILGGAHTPFVGTGFLIGRGALASTDFVLTDFEMDGKPRYAMFGEKEVLIEQIIGRTKDDRHGALARIEPPGQAPLQLDWDLPQVGTRIAVIGHPLITFTPTVTTISAFSTYPTGEKMIMPGVIVAVEESALTYECWTMEGVAGGPILDLATGKVIGIHHSGKYVGGTKKLGFGVPVKAIKDLLQTPV